MKILSRHKGWGKTTKLLREISKNPNAVLLVGYEFEKQRLINDLEYSNRYGIKKEIACRIYTWQEFRKMPNMQGADVYIDNLDQILAYMFGKVIKATITNNNPVRNRRREEAERFRKEFYGAPFKW